MIPSFSRGQRHEGIGAGDDVVHAKQELAVAADGKRVDRRDPRLLDATPAHVVGQQVGRRDAAEDLVNVTKFTPREPEERDLAAIEMREIDAGAEHAPAAILRLVDRAAPQHDDAARRVERGDIDCDFHLIERRVVFGIEEAGIDGGEMDRAPLAMQPRRAKIENTIGCELRGEFDAVLPRQQHRMTEVPAGLLAGKNVGEKQPLVDFDPVLVALVECGFRRHLRSCRHETGKILRRVVDEILDADERGSRFRQPVVDPIAMRGEEAVARCPGGREDRVGGSAFSRAPLGFGGKTLQELVRPRPERGVADGILLPLAGALRLGRRPFAHGRGGEPGRRQGSCIGWTHEC